MALTSSYSGRGLDFFSSCDIACKKAVRLLSERSAQGSWKSLSRLAKRDLSLVHELPLQAMNDKLKKYPFVDPTPFDELLTAVDKVANIVSTSKSIEDDLEVVARFECQIPLKLRELQTMTRPFLEVDGIHSVEGVDAITAEIVRCLLKLHNLVKVWEWTLTCHLKELANAGFAARHFEQRVTALAGLCATAELSVFEASQRLRLQRSDTHAFKVPEAEIDAICQRLPDLAQERLFKGSCSARLEHGANPKFGEEDAQGINSIPGLEEVRAEALQWWWDQGFASAAPCRILAAAIWNHMRQSGLHPDPWVAEHLPLLLHEIYGVQMSCDTFMNNFLLKLGGYIASNNVEVPIGQGLPLLTDVNRTAESLLRFVRQWCKLSTELKEEAASTQNQDSFKKKSVKRASKFKMDTFLDAMTQTGHSVNDVIELLEGAKRIEDHVLRVPASEQRYRVDADMIIRWELLTRRNQDLQENIPISDRDKGPYITLPTLITEDDLKAVWRGLYHDGASFLVNSEVYHAAKEKYFMNEDDSEEEELVHLSSGDDVSDFFGFKLIEAHQDLDSSSRPSLFLSFLRGENTLTSRRQLPGLPALPWCLGTDPRNTMVLDLEAQGLAPFHCILKKAAAQERRVCIAPLHGDRGESYIVLPMYQPIQVRDGYHLRCHDWLFELNIEHDYETNTSALTIMTEDGTSFQSPFEGCHIGVGTLSRKRPYQPAFPTAKMVLTSRTEKMQEVHLVFLYEPPTNRWTVVNHCPDERGGLMVLSTGTSYPLSLGLRVRLGPLLLECALDEQFVEEE
eukprot:TRINITY_DN1280_c0_g1_i1.p1 TRINITY_DN1280_c0_g1~~TRINITY_DN1280_c0_g1_i1.p1  ORF type:complete len:794 (-),score=166.52 TRINITY_DN1280_c0_g1_i1:99-2480(-)